MRPSDDTFRSLVSRPPIFSRNATRTSEAATNPIDMIPIIRLGGKTPNNINPGNSSARSTIINPAGQRDCVAPNPAKPITVPAEPASLHLGREAVNARQRQSGMVSRRYEARFGGCDMVAVAR